MNRYRNYGTLDDAPEIFGDRQFNALDMQSDPTTLPPGTVQASRNVRFDTQGTQVRGGVKLLFAAGTSLTPLRYAGLYTPVRGNDQHALVLADRLMLFDSTEQTLTAYPFPAGETVDDSDPVFLVQAGVDEGGSLPNLYLLRGFSQTAMKFDGNAVTLDPTFQRGTFALYYQDRIAVNDTYQSLKVSDFLDFETFTLLNQFQIESGGADYLVGMMAYQKDYVLIGSRRKWFVAFFDPKTASGGYSGGLDGDTSFLRLLTSEAGPIGNEAMTVANGKIWFASDKGIFAFVPQLDNELTVLGEPISYGIQPVYERLSTNFGDAVSIKHYGYRLYFALPISDEPIAVTDIVITGTPTNGVDLPFDLPVDLAESATATVETLTPHNLSMDDLVQMSGSPTAALNGQKQVLTVPDDTHFTFGVDADSDAAIGSAVTMQKIATRNNTIAVYNLKYDAWETIDTLPSGFYADWLRVANYGSQLRLYVVDAEEGPALYEEGDADEIESIIGGISLPFDLPVDLSEADYASVSIAGYIKSRTLQWQQVQGDTYTLQAAYPRRVRTAEARLICQPGDTGNITLTVRTPNRQPWTKSRNFPVSAKTDSGCKLRCGKRGLEAEIELTTTSGRPVLRALEVETSTDGRVAE